MNSLKFLLSITKREFPNDVNTFAPGFSILIKIVFINILVQCQQI